MIGKAKGREGWWGVDDGWGVDLTTGEGKDGGG